VIKAVFATRDSSKNERCLTTLLQPIGKRRRRHFARRAPLSEKRGNSGA
jgi:hypothetical protein